MLKLSSGPLTLSRDELKDILFHIRGAKPVTITARTVPKLIGGKSNPLAGMEKVATVNGIINFCYENAVNSQRAREAEEIEDVELFEALPRTWGSRLFTDNNRMIPLVDKVKHDNPYLTFEDVKKIPTEQLLLELKVQKSLEHNYYLNEEVIPNEVAEEQVYQSPGSRQGVKKEVLLRDYYLTNIEQVVMDGNTFVLGYEVSLPQLIENQKARGGVVAV